MKKNKGPISFDWQLVKLGWLPAAITAAGFLFYLVLGQRLVAKISEYSADTSSSRTKLAVIKDKVDYLESVDSEEIEKLSGLLEVAVFADNKAYLLLGTVRKVAADYGYQVDSFDLSPGDLLKEGKGVVAKEAAPLRVRLGLIGPKERYEEYLGAIEKSLPIMSIEELKTKSLGDLSYLEMGINAYFVPAKGRGEIDSLSLSELKLGTEEKRLLSLLGEFKVVPQGQENDSSGGGFVKYERNDPFSQ